MLATSTTVTGFVQNLKLKSAAYARSASSNKNNKLYASSIDVNESIEMMPVYHGMSSRYKTSHPPRLDTLYVSNKNVPNTIPLEITAHHPLASKSANARRNASLGVNRLRLLAAPSPRASSSRVVGAARARDVVHPGRRVRARTRDDDVVVLAVDAPVVRVLTSRVVSTHRPHRARDVILVLVILVVVVVVVIVVLDVLDVDAVALVIARIATLRPRSSSNVHDARASRSVVFIRTRDVNRRVDRARGDSSRVVIGRMSRHDTRSTARMKTNEDTRDRGLGFRV